MRESIENLDRGIQTLTLGRLRLREPMSGLLHLGGAALALIGVVHLVLQALRAGSSLHVVASLIFGVSMVLLYCSSTLYHLLPLSPVGIRRLRRLDHAMIYIFIAGSYTPISLVALDGGWSWGVSIGVWALAMIGVALKLVWLESSRWVRILLYLLMSWLSLAILPVLWPRLAVGAFIWMGIGGAAYTLGAMVYASKRPNPWPRVFGFHEIWHLFVMAGTFSHYWMIKAYVLPL